MFNIGDRVVLQSDFKYHKAEVKAGTVGTVTMLLDNQAIIRHGYDYFANRQLIAGISMDLLRLATMEELENTNPLELVLPMYHIGQKIIMGLGVSINGIKTNDIGIITDYTCALNEKNDMFTVDFTHSIDENAIHNLKMSFIEAYCHPYDEEIEKKLGEQIDFENVKKNYHIIGARMFLANKSPEDVVILLDQKENSKFEVIDINGVIKEVSKESLVPITGTDLELFGVVGYSYFIRKEFSVGKRFKAKEEIAKHALLNEEFKPGDVVEIVHINEIFINSFDDTVAVERTGGSAIVVSVTELANYFEPFVGMVKKSTGHVISKSDDLAEIEKEMLGDKPKDEKVVLMMPVVNDNIPPVDNVKINDITINGFRFTMEDDIIFLNYDDKINIDNLDDYIRSLTLLKEYVKRR